MSGQRGGKAQGELVTVGTLQSGPQPLLLSDTVVQASAPFFPRTLGPWPPVSFLLRPGGTSALFLRPSSPDLQSPVHDGSPLVGSSAPTWGSQPHFIPCIPSPGGLGRGEFSKTSELGVEARSSCRGWGGAEPNSPGLPLPPHSGMDACLIAGAILLQGWLGLGPKLGE